MADVRAEDRVETRPHRVGAGVEGPRVGGVVRLAAEVEPRHEEIADVLLLLDAATEVVVGVLHPAVERRVRVALEALAARDGLDHLGPSVPPGQLQQPPAVEPARVRGLDGLPVALLPVADEVRVEHAGPAHPALQEREVEVGKAPRDPAEEERLGHRVPRGGEVADVVVAEVGGRVAQEDRTRPVVEGRGQLEVAARPPHRVVVVRAVDADDVVPLHETGRLRPLLEERGHRPPHHPAHHDHPVAELGGRELDLLDRFLGRVHGDDRGRDHPVLEAAELVRREDVVGAADGPPQPRVLHAVVAQPGGRIHHREVDAEIRQPLVEQPRQHGGGAVQHVLARRGPERFLADPAARALRHRHPERVGHPLARQRQPLHGGLAADLAERLAHHRAVLEPVPVGVDDRMGETGAERPGIRVAVVAHGEASCERNPVGAMWRAGRR